MDSLIGQNLGKYRIDRLLGEGGMGAVYQAHDTILARTVAIKVMHRQYSAQHDFQERFLQEARTAARLNHPGIIKVYAFEELDSLLSISMEFIAGENLRQMLESMVRERKWLALPEAVKLIAHIGMALDYAHRQGVFHRDVKPANIMLKQDPERANTLQPILTDLGLVKLAEGGLVTQANVAMGTPAYMSPEQATGQVADARSDVYSLGVLLYELAAGQLPFPIRTITEAIRYHVHEQAPRPRILHPGLPPVLEQVILRMLEKSPAQRFASAREAVQLLSTIPISELAAPVPPSAVAGVRNVTIATLHSLGIEPPPPPPPPPDPLPPAPDSTDPYLEIVTPDGVPRTMNIKQRSFAIGRDGNNDIVLQDGRVSRQHAKLEFDGVRFRITDLNSSNGTYLGATKLAKGATQVWRSGVDLRLGDHRLRFVLPSAAAEPPSPRRRPRYLWLLLLLVAVGLLFGIWQLAGYSLLYGTNAVEGQPTSLPVTTTPQRTPLPSTAEELDALQPGDQSALESVLLVKTPTPTKRPTRIATRTPLPAFTPTIKAAATHTPKPIFTPTPRQTPRSTRLPTRMPTSAAKSGPDTTVAGITAELPTTVIDFSEDPAQWAFSAEDITFKVVDGELEIAIQKSSWQGLQPLSLEGSNYFIQVDIIIEAPTNQVSGGILFNYVDTENYDQFVIDHHGAYYVGRKVNDVWESIQSWTDSDVLKTGEGSSNRIGLLMFEDGYMIVANGEVLAEFENLEPPLDSVGLTASTLDDTEVVVRFDDVKWWDLTGQKIP